MSHRKTVNGLSIGPMYFDPGWPLTGLLQNCTSNIAKIVTDTMIASMEVE